MYHYFSTLRPKSTQFEPAWIAWNQRTMCIGHFSKNSGRCVTLRMGKIRAGLFLVGLDLIAVD